MYHLQFDKNAEYGYRNIIPLSAGLDCRMVCYAAKKLGIENVLTFTYSETNQEDAIVPAKMARDLQYQWIFKNLDNGLDLFDIENSIKITDGLIYYPWVSQLNTFLNYINTQNLGIIHTGVIGDVILGSFVKSMKCVEQKYKLGDGAYSTKLANRIEELKICDESYEVGMLRNRAINGACLGYSTSFRQYGEAMSPFMDVDFAEFCFSLPMEYRVQHNIYYAWVSQKYPEAAKFPHNGVRISQGKYIKIHGKRYYLNSMGDLLRNKMRAKFDVNMGMNPMEYWYKSNSKLSNKLDKFYAENKHFLSKYKDLYKDMNELYINGSALEKTMVISLIGSYRYLFLEGESQ